MELALHQADTLQLPHDGAVHVKARHADGALAALAYVLSVPALHREVARRGGNMREIPGLCTVAIEDPSAYLALNPERRLDPWVALAEFPWLIAGRSDVAWISAYLPRAVDFSDNGKHWRAGYGPRLRQWGSFAGPELDQLGMVVALLRRDLATRQAVLSLWDPAADLGVRSKDVPCTNWLHFQCHPDMGGMVLDLTVVMRSNDLMWGFSGVNIVNFCLLLQAVACAVGVRAGTYRHVASNMHAYERHFARLRPIAEGYDIRSVIRSSPTHAPYAAEISTFTRRCRAAVEMVEIWRDTKERPFLKPHDWKDDVQDQWLGDWCYFMSLHSYATRNVGEFSAEWWKAAAAWVREPAWRLALASFLARQHAPYIRVAEHVLYDLAPGAATGAWLHAAAHRHTQQDEAHA
jgi:thymidylate synthase